ncbi:hypothetical protein NHP190003_12090 [Helicobacter sp. NHP19-003]|uniref:Uncharacterized protein n=1 Tax=Helicobacter gastrocanis TaxID=2849641 RepID=A0ABM7SDQ2_9HELI|nr:hypothetical protein [Helicobacter sp. NHP19-003]BCZ17927.1 hypothetical protein NHP190003_12090 [Helicobacter sp. NHP19-003]
MIVKTYKPKVLKIASLLGLGFLALAPWLSAENSGFYGSVGFQYSNMTRAESSNGGMGIPPTATLNGNPFLGATTQGVNVPQFGNASTDVNQYNGTTTVPGLPNYSQVK